MTDEQINLREMGFLGAFPGREYRVFARADGQGAGTLTLQAAALRANGDDVSEAANAEGLRLAVAFDDAHPDFLLMEASGESRPVESMARRLVHAGYRLLMDVPADPTAPYDLTRAGEGLDSLPDFMTEEELAHVLRRTVQTVQRYRLNGALPYISGRPPIIAKTDLFEWLKQFRTVKPVHSDWKKEYRTIVPYGKGVDDTPGKLVRDARAHVMKMKMKPVRRRRKPD